MYNKESGADDLLVGRQQQQKPKGTRRKYIGDSDGESYYDQLPQQLDFHKALQSGLDSGGYDEFGATGLIALLKQCYSLKKIRATLKTLNSSAKKSVVSLSSLSCYRAAL